VKPVTCRGSSRIERQPGKPLWLARREEWRRAIVTEDSRRLAGAMREYSRSACTRWRQAPRHRSAR